MGLVFGGELLGFAAYQLVQTASPLIRAIGVLLVAALILGGFGTALLDWLLRARMRRMSAEMEELRRQAALGQQMSAALAEHGEQMRRLRHDIRGALSPALLIADRLLGHADPAVVRSGQIMVRTVERATGLLSDTEPAPQQRDADRV